MYEFIEGRLIEKHPAYLVVMAGGIGYIISISLNTFEKVKERENVRLFLHHSIKNEATKPVGFELFGFAERQERELFRHLISVSGVGNNTGMLILSSLSTSQLLEAITRNNPGILESVKGIGKKSAQRIILDLKDKLSKTYVETEISTVSHNTKRNEALSGLIVLGFNKLKAAKAIDKVIKNSKNELAVEEIIKEALQNM
jgi:Holliday junction DNA helicase RuvA